MAPVAISRRGGGSGRMKKLQSFKGSVSLIFRDGIHDRRPSSYRSSVFPKEATEIGFSRKMSRANQRAYYPAPTALELKTAGGCGPCLEKNK